VSGWEEESRGPRTKRQFSPTLSSSPESELACQSQTTRPSLLPCGRVTVFLRRAHTQRAQGAPFRPSISMALAWWRPFPCLAIAADTVQRRTLATRLPVAFIWSRAPRCPCPWPKWFPAFRLLGLMNLYILLYTQFCRTHSSSIYHPLSTLSTVGSTCHFI
jgi:hypothetical protein